MYFSISATYLYEKNTSLICSSFARQSVSVTYSGVGDQKPQVGSTAILFRAGINGVEFTRLNFMCHVLSFNPKSFDASLTLNSSHRAATNNNLSSLPRVFLNLRVLDSKPKSNNVCESV